MSIFEHKGRGRFPARPRPARGPGASPRMLERLRIAMLIAIVIMLALPFIISETPSPSVASGSSAAPIRQPRPAASPVVPAPQSPPAAAPKPSLKATTLRTPAFQASLRAVPNPVRVCDSSGLGVTTMEFVAAADSTYAIHIHTADGPLFARFDGPRGIATTFRWVTHGMKFVAVDEATGREVASTRIMLTQKGCIPSRTSK